MQVIFLPTSGLTPCKEQRHLFLSILQLKYSSICITETLLSSSVLPLSHMQQYVCTHPVHCGEQHLGTSHTKKKYHKFRVLHQKALCAFKTD